MDDASFDGWSPYTVRSISSAAVVADGDATVETATAPDGVTYLPVPADRAYLDLAGGDREAMADAQLVSPDLPLLDGMRVLADHPFLLFEDGTGDGSGDGYRIVTRADLNRRPVEAAIYPVVSTLEDRIATAIRREYPDPTDLVPLVGPFPVGAWTKARGNDLAVHLAEFLSLTDMVGIVKGNDHLLSACGYDDPGELESDLHAVGELRNRVMHGNRSLVMADDDVRTHVDHLDLATGMIDALDETTDGDRD